MEGLRRAAEKRLAELKGRQQELERELYSIDEKTAAAAAAAAVAATAGGAGDGRKEEGDEALVSVVAESVVGGGGEGMLGLEAAVREAYVLYKQARHWNWDWNRICDPAGISSRFIFNDIDPPPPALLRTHRCGRRQRRRRARSSGRGRGCGTWRRFWACFP
jgi:hypothetical protein